MKENMFVSRNDIAIMILLAYNRVNNARPYLLRSTVHGLVTEWRASFCYFSPRANFLLRIVKSADSPGKEDATYHVYIAMRA